MSQEQNGAGEDGRDRNQPSGRSLRERMSLDLQLRGGFPAREPGGRNNKCRCRKAPHRLAIDHKPGGRHILVHSLCRPLG